MNQYNYKIKILFELSNCSWGLLEEYIKNNFKTGLSVINGVEANKIVNYTSLKNNILFDNNKNYGLFFNTYCDNCNIELFSKNSNIQIDDIFVKETNNNVGFSTFNTKIIIFNLN